MAIFKFSSVLYFMGLALAVFWTLALLGVKQGNRTPNRILASLLCLISVSMLSVILHDSGYINKVPHLIGVSWPLGFIYPPLFFLYVRALTSRKFRLSRYLPHFLPFAASVIYLMPFFVQSGEDKIAFIMAIAEPTVEERVASLLIIVQELIYITWSLLILRRHARNMKQVHSASGNIHLSWIRNLIVSYLIITAVFILLQFYGPAMHGIPVGAMLVLAFIYLLGYLGVKQPAVFLGPEDANVGKKYEKSGLTSERAEEHLAKLVDLMKIEKPFLDSKLTLSQLAQKLSISTHHLSQLLNERLRLSFFDFVNQHRVEEAKKELANPDKAHLTILAIAYEAGFSSKSSFNSTFKKHTNLTPAQFRKTTEP